MRSGEIVSVVGGIIAGLPLAIAEVPFSWWQIYVFAVAMITGMVAEAADRRPPTPNPQRSVRR